MPPNNQFPKEISWVKWIQTRASLALLAQWLQNNRGGSSFLCKENFRWQSRLADTGFTQFFLDGGKMGFDRERRTRRSS